MYWCVALALGIPRTLASVQALRNMAALGMLSGVHDGIKGICERLGKVYRLHEYAQLEEVQALADGLGVLILVRSINVSYQGTVIDTLYECVPRRNRVDICIRGRIVLLHNLNHYNAALPEVTHRDLLAIGDEVIQIPDRTEEVTNLFIACILACRQACRPACSHA